MHHAGRGSCPDSHHVGGRCPAAGSCRRAPPSLNGHELLPAAWRLGSLEPDSVRRSDRSVPAACAGAPASGLRSTAHRNAAGGTPSAGNVLDPPDDPIVGAYRLLRSRFGAEVTTDDRTVVFRLHGELDMATAPRLARALSTTLDTGPSSIAVELSELTFVDSTGLDVFLTASRRAARIGCSFTLRSPRRAVLKTLRLTGLDGRINIGIGDAVL